MKIFGQNFKGVKILTPEAAGLRHVLQQSALFDGQTARFGDEVD